jgi:hypothetical protein
MADLPQRASRSQAARTKKDTLVRVIEAALPDGMVRRARRAVARLGRQRLAESYFTTFWLPRGARPRNAVEEAVLALSRRARVRCAGMEWWIGRSYTTRLPIEFHFDEDVKGDARRQPRISSVFFFNQVRGGQLAVTDATPQRPVATRLQAVKPRRNRYALFAGNLLHGVLDARGRTPSRPLPGPRGRLRITLVVNYWQKRPAGVPEWSSRGIYRALTRRKPSRDRDGGRRAAGSRRRGTRPRAPSA